jgi:hypothetical protein
MSHGKAEREVSGEAEVSDGADYPVYGEVSWPLHWAIMLMPLVFFWLLLRPGYSPGSRVFGGFWIVMWSMVAFSTYASWFT